MLPFEQPGARKSQFGFVERDGHFDLPSTSISMHNVPGDISAADGLVGEQILGGLVLAASDDQIVFSPIKNEKFSACGDSF